MTKKELLAIVQKIHDEADKLGDDILSLKDRARKIQSLTEEIPEEVNEITNDEEGE